MVKLLLNKYLALIIKYSDVNSELKHILANILAIIPFIGLNYVFFYLLLGYRSEYVHELLIVLAIGKGRLFLVYIMKKYNCDFGKGWNGYAIVLPILGVSMGIIVGMYIIINDIKGDFEKDKKNELIKNNVEIKKEIDVLEKYR